MLLLDEPFGALDAFTREELWCILRDLLDRAALQRDPGHARPARDRVPGRHGVRDEQEPGPLRGEARDRAAAAARPGGHLHARSSPTSCTSCAATSAPSASTARRGGGAHEARRQLERWSPWLLLVAVLLLWQLVCSAFDVSEFIFPSPWRIAHAVRASSSGVDRRPRLAHLLGHDGRLRPGDRGRRAARLRDRQLAPGLRGDVSADDRLQRGAQGGLRADPGGLVRHRPRARRSSPPS